jgi:hypothetical protein
MQDLRHSRLKYIKSFRFISCASLLKIAEVPGTISIPFVRFWCLQRLGTDLRNVKIFANTELYILGLESAKKGAAIQLGRGPEWGYFLSYSVPLTKFWYSSSIRGWSLFPKSISIPYSPSYNHSTIYRVSQKERSISCGHRIGHYKQKCYIYMCPIPNGFQNRAISLYISKIVDKKKYCLLFLIPVFIIQVKKLV